MVLPLSDRLRTSSVVAALLLLGVCNSEAVQLVRGPYLQTGTPTSIVVRWRTDEPTESIVRYGTAADALPAIASDLVKKTEHVVELVGLKPATRYFYSVGHSSGPLASGADYRFVTHPPEGQRTPTRIWVIGDCGTFATGAGNQLGVRDAYYRYVGDRHTDVWLALGDNAYYNGTDAEYQASFFNVYPLMLRQTVLWSTLGNHETYAAPVGSPIPYFDMFSFPKNAEAGGVASGTEKYYSFNYANIHFVCLDSELSARTADSPMLTWLRADLEANTSDWLIAFWHSPPYSKGSHDSDNPFDNFGNMTEMRENAVRVLEAHGVDLVLSGHSHIYERSYLLNGHYGLSNTLVPSMVKDAGSGRSGDTGAYRKGGRGPAANQGAVYIVAGSSGWATSRTGFHPAMFFDELQVGSLVLDVTGDRLEAKFLRETGAIDDYFTILKGAAPEELRICTFAVGNGETLVRWKSVAGEAYRVEHSRTLSPATWTPISDRVVASGATTSWSAPIPPEQRESFYRVVRLAADPPPATRLNTLSGQRSAVRKEVPASRAQKRRGSR